MRALLDTACGFWKMPAAQIAVFDTRARLRHVDTSTWFPDNQAADRLRDRHAMRSPLREGIRKRVPIPDISRFAVAAAMRLREIIDREQADMNAKDRHPHPESKHDQTSPATTRICRYVAVHLAANDEHSLPTTSQ